MNHYLKNVISLIEYETRRIPRSEFSEELWELLYRNFDEKVRVNPPSFLNDQNWEFTAQGWVGYIPLTEEVSFSLEPKVPLNNLFGMWEYAYRLQSFKILEGLFTCNSLDEFYQQLAHILAKKILYRGRIGYYRTYLSIHEITPYVCGQLDMQRVFRKPWDTRIYSRYQDHTPDIEENQILAWTISAIARSGLCGDRVGPAIRKAYRDLVGKVTLSEFSPLDCTGRIYNRLNQDYHPLHALCRFFLENSGPKYELGDKTMLPFLVDMAHLFELFVAEWIKAHLPDKYDLKIQDTVDITPDGKLQFKIDMVLYDLKSNLPGFILDTKYKYPESIKPEDIAQVISYAESKGCHEAVLVYPQTVPEPLDQKIGEIRLRSLSFDLDGDLESAGNKLLKQLLLTDQTNENQSVSMAPYYQ